MTDYYIRADPILRSLIWITQHVHCRSGTSVIGVYLGTVSTGTLVWHVVVGAIIAMR